MQNPFIVDKKNQILKEIFGHNSFKKYQEEAIESILAKQDILMIIPTGGGKSLSFQLPTLMMDGVTIIISPLIALMQDQVQALRAQSIKAAMLGSNQDQNQNDTIISQLIADQLKFLYISPERLNTPKMQAILSSIKINFFVIDEAHCISEWGHEFRDDYRSLSILKSQFPKINIAAFTATATPAVQEDIIRLLNLQKPFVLKGLAYRKNLKITIQQRIQRGFNELLEFLKPRIELNGIIYMSSRKKCEALCEFLNSHGFDAQYYHAGMSTQERNNVFECFIKDKVKIVVATIAFGMGINKSDIRFVVHMSMPKTLENYYQEIGRAGRDGESAEALMFYSSEDLVYAKMRMDEIEDEKYRRVLQEKLTRIYQYVSTETCRHQFIASYFNDTIAPCEDSCDNCLSEDVDKCDITIDTQKILSTIYRTNQRFGKGYIIDVLRGSQNAKIIQNSHDELSVFGIGKEKPKKYWYVIIDRLLELQNLSFGDFQTLLITHEGIQTLKGKTKINIASNRLIIKESLKRKSVALEDVDFDMELFEKLKSLRSDVATRLNVPAYIVFSDKTLKEMAKVKPQNKEQFLKINGVGERKLEQFGEEFLTHIGLYM
jgi:ATP-dependent DNA helicase RecQ